jgi:AcrR family transcriptional regulator
MAFVNTEVYGARDMSRKLTPDDWTRAGLQALARDGFTAVKADLLAKSLGVSRGSFYWHFADMDAFQLAVMQRWQKVATDAIIREVEGAAAGTDRLLFLLRLAFKADAAHEIAMRSWAVSHGQARAIVKAVDTRRLVYIERLFSEAGLEQSLARARAQIVYWTYIGFVLSEKPAEGAELEHLIEELASLARPGGE